MSKPLFTIVTTTYNRENYLPECLDSISKQTYRGFEQVFIDGESTDGTVDIIKKYIKDNPDIPIKFISRPPRGVYDAFNAALDVVRGQYINFLNSDDFFYDENTLDIVSQAIQEDPSRKWIQSKYRTTHYKGTTFKRLSINRTADPVKVLLKQPFIVFGAAVSHQAQFISKSVFKEFGKFDTSYRIVADYDFMLRVSPYIPPHIVEDPLAVIRSHKGSLSTNGISNLGEILREAFRARRLFLTDIKRS